MSCEQCIYYKDKVEMLIPNVSGTVTRCKKDLPTNNPCAEYKPNFVTRFDETVRRGKKRE